jgi:hypothetical protein
VATNRSISLEGDLPIVGIDDVTPPAVVSAETSGAVSVRDDPFPVAPTAGLFGRLKFVPAELQFEPSVASTRVRSTHAAEDSVISTATNTVATTADAKVSAMEIAALPRVEGNFMVAS